MKLIRGLFIAILILLAGWAGYEIYQSQRGLSRAERLAERGFWEYTRNELDRYLWLHPGDGKARLLMAEALVKDEELDGEQAIREALEHLERVSDRSPQAAQARTQEGRLLFYMMHQPAHAERQLRKAIELDPNSLEAQFTLWKLFDMTGRAHLGGSMFWNVYELTPEPDRPQRLREWYLSQFYSATANPAISQMMGLDQITANLPTDDPEFKRFLLFREMEPNEPLGHAMLAKWFQVQGTQRDALELLDEAARELDNEATEQMFLSTLIGVLIDLGESERALSVLDAWPEPHEGYEYWVAKGTVLSETTERLEEAVAAFDKALATEWPGPVDWRTMNLKANALAKMGRAKEAKVLRQKARSLEPFLNDDLHEELRKQLVRLDSGAFERMAKFYTDIGCKREAECWSALAGEGRPSPPVATKDNS